MKVLVTGAAGLLGDAVTRQLLARGDEVVAVDALCRYRLFGDARKQHAPAWADAARVRFVEASFADPEVLAMLGGVNAVVHCAANTSHPLSILQPATDFKINAEGTFRVLEAIRTATRRPRLINIGSAKVYDMTIAVEEHATRFDHLGSLVGEGWPLGGFVTPFGVSKLAADLYVSNYSKLYDLDACTIRPGCFTGPRSLAVELQNWAPVLVRAMVHSEMFKVFGYAGKQVRDLLHVSDLARLVLACIDREEPWRGEVLNACGGPERSVSILEAVALIERISGKRGELRFEPERPADWKWFIGDSTRAEVVLGWHPRVSLETIFEELIEEASHAL